MSKLKFPPAGESKLSKTLAKMSQDGAEKTGFITSKNDKTLYFKTKSFRLRELDFTNLAFIVKEINKKNKRKLYSDSEVIRGIINFTSDNLEANSDALLACIRDAS